MREVADMRELPRVADLRLQWAGVTDAGCATITHEVEADFIKILLQAGCLKVGRDHLRAGGQRCLDPGLAVQTQRGSFAGHQPSTNHDVGVGGLGKVQNVYG